MNRTFLNSGIVLSALIGASAVIAPAPAQAFSFTVQGTDNFGSDPIKTNVSIEQAGGNIKYTVSLVPETFYGTGNVGDLLGFFFDVADESLVPSLGIVANSLVTNSLFAVNSVTQVGSNANNLNGGNGIVTNNPFDAGIQIGRQGASGGNITSIMFEVTSTLGALSISDFDKKSLRVGIRAQNVGNGGSAKAVGQVPTPALLPGLLGLGVAALRKKQGEDEQEA